MHANAFEPPPSESVITTLDQGVATLMLNRPEQRNPLDPATLTSLIELLNWAAQTDAVGAVVITGAGKAFSAGADLSSLSADLPDAQRHRDRHLFVELFLTMRRMPKPILGRINGAALAGGLGLACSCDVVVASEDATFGTPEIGVGIWPMMIQAPLSRQLPPKILLEMMMLGQRWSAGQMKDLGLVSRVVPATELDATTYELAGRLAAQPAAAIALGKESFYHQREMEFDSALEYLHSLTETMMQTEDSREGIRAFLEKRPPVFVGR
jgi:enoyl-CoA hydratase/carnithine racemase